MEGKTYSEKNDISECKSCNDCKGRNVLQKCSKLNNGKCGTCLPEYYSDSEVDDCKKCSFCCEDALEHEHLRQCKDLGMPRHMQCEDSDKNRKCKIQALLLNSTTTSRPLVTVSPTSKLTQTSGSRVTAVPSGGTEVSMTIRKSVATPSDSSPKTHDDTYGLYGVVGVSSVLVLGAIVCAAVKLKRRNGSRNRRRIGTIYSSIEQGEGQEMIELRQRTENMANVYVQYNFYANGLSSNNQSTESSAASSTELIKPTDVPSVKTFGANSLDLQVSLIPEDLLLKGVLTDVNVMDELSRGLDPVCPPGTSYWVHLAEVLQVTDEVKMRCQCNPQCSPSKHMLDFKEAVDRDFLVQQLKDGLRAISRNDLVQKVEECDLPYTAPFRDLREHHPKVLEVICIQLDHFKHWQKLGEKFKIPDKKLLRIGTSSTCAKTVLEIIEKRNPELTVQDMKLVLEYMSREDVCDALDKYRPPEGCYTIKTVCENPYCLDEVAPLLDKETPGVENWQHFAWRFDVPREICESLKPKETPSPTAALIEHIVQDKPNTTVKTFMKALMKIERADVVNALLTRLSGSSNKDNTAKNST